MNEETFSYMSSDAQAELLSAVLERESLRHDRRISAETEENI